MSRQAIFESNGVSIFHGDCREVLRQLPSESVHCCVTSPPYWGLRDYGTASWEGGLEDCDHQIPAATLGGGSNKGHNGSFTANYSQQCGKCGATRIDRQIGLEDSPVKYIATMREVFAEVRRVLRNDGTLWLNIGDSYNAGTSASRQESKSGAVGRWQREETVGGNGRINVGGLKVKDLVGIPWMLAFALREDGWYLRQDIVWSKPNPMPESVTDRCTKSHEYIFLLSKSERYYYDADAIQELSVTDDIRRPYTSQGAWQLDGRPVEQRHGGEPRGRTGKNAFRGQGANRENDNGHANRDGREMRDVGAGITRNKRSVWSVATEPYPEAHFATFPQELIKPCILAGTSEKGCCANCGAPWRRMVAPSEEYAQHLGEGKRVNGHDYERDAIAGMRIQKKLNAEYQTVGWEPSCKCDAGLDRCTVLDPFMGAATVAVVARLNHCRAIGIELNLEYIEMAKRRLSQQVLDFASAEPTP